MPIYEVPKPAASFFLCDCCGHQAEPSFTQRVWSKVFEPDDLDYEMVGTKKDDPDVLRVGWAYTLDFGHKECLDARR